MLLSESAIASTICHKTVFEEIKSDRSYHVPEDCQYDLLYWPLLAKLSIYSKDNMLPFQELSILFRLLATFEEKSIKLLTLHITHSSVNFP